MEKLKFECINELLKGTLLKACDLNGVYDHLSKGLCGVLSAVLDSQNEHMQIGAAIVCEKWDEVVLSGNVVPDNDNEETPTLCQKMALIDTRYPRMVRAVDETVEYFLQRVHELPDKEANRTMISTLFPCPKCMQAVADAGITDWIYITDGRPNAYCSADVKTIAEACGVKLTSAKEAFGDDTAQLVKLAFAGLKGELSVAIANIEKRCKEEETQAYINFIEAPGVAED